MNVSECESCGGKIVFSPSNKALKCVNCGNIYPIEYNKTEVKHPIENIVADTSKWSEQNRSYKCENCGAQITLNKYDIAGKCQYCNTSGLTPLKDLPGLKPEIIIPFKIDKEQATNEFKTSILKRNFLPTDFRKNIPKTDIGATYIRSFTFELNVYAKYRGTICESRTVRRNGRMETITTRRPFSGVVNRFFDNILIEASDKLEQSDIKAILPYNFNESYDYQDEFVKGYSVGYYNQTVENAEQSAKKEAYLHIESMIRSQYSSIESLTIDPTYSNIKYNYALLPVYFVKFDYKNKPYVNLINGQTGKLGGKVPRSSAQIFAMVLFIILVIGLPILFILFSNL